MKAELREIPVEVYAHEVLPHTAALWAGRRSFELYQSQTLEIAHSAYGKRFYRTIGLFEGSRLLASCKRYERTARVGSRRLRACGIGAVFTAQELRGRGYASAMLGALLDAARDEGFGAAYLFSDIRPQFYAQLGFTELPSRSISLRADTLDGGHVAAEPLGARDWSGVRGCFDALDARRGWALERSPLVWDWIRLRLRQGCEHASGQPVRLVVRRGRTVSAYLIGRREPVHDAFVLDEFGYADDAGREEVPRLLRAAAGDLRRVTGWLAPEGARQALPRGSVRRRPAAIWMAAGLTALGREFVQNAAAPAPFDGVWSTDHV